MEAEGLVGALEKRAAALSARHHIEVEATIPEEPEATPEIKEALYRIAQEAMQNTVKHARAKVIKVCLEQNVDGISLAIEDNGAGFDPSGDFPGHLGLRSMRERAERLGGSLEVESSPESGTRILATIPCG